MKKCITAKNLIDDFFKNCRDNLHIYAFESETKSKLKFLTDNKYKYIVTVGSKNNFFKPRSNNVLSEEGAEIIFNELTKEELQSVKKELFDLFENTFFIKIKLNDTRNKDNSSFSGIIILKNLRVK